MGRGELSHQEVCFIIPESSLIFNPVLKMRMSRLQALHDSGREVRCMVPALTDEELGCGEAEDCFVQVPVWGAGDTHLASQRERHFGE